jgi:tetratricopeptide (TPR) repeat protein
MITLSMRLLIACTLAAGLAAQGTPPVRPPQIPTKPPVGAQRPKQPGTERPPNGRIRSATGDALDRYAGGEYERAVKVLLSLGGFNLEQAQAWINVVDGPQRERRRLIAATLVLEIVAAKDAWPAHLVEWACDAFKAAGAATPNEALWLRASIALAEGHGMWPFLVTPPVPAAGQTPARLRAEPKPDAGHIAHAHERFPDDPYFMLAGVVAAEVKASEPDKPSATKSDQTPVAFDRISSLLAGPAPLSTDQDRALHAALTTLEPLLASPSVGAEAHVRSGHILLRLGRADDALPHFHAASEGAEPAIKYLGHMYAAWTLAHQSKAAAAIAEYRAALRVVPHARSAASLLTALLLMNDETTQAEALVDQEISTLSAGIDDPWRTYLLGDYRHYPALLARLREAIR